MFIAINSSMAYDGLRRCVGMTKAQIVQKFLDNLAATSTPAYKPLLESISNWFHENEYLTARQRQAIRINASVRHVDVPEELRCFPPPVRTPYVALPEEIVEVNPISELALNIAEILTKFAASIK
jgi:hypothetical protein